MTNPKGSQQGGEQLGTCDKKQYEHCGPHRQIGDTYQSCPPFPCVNWKPIRPASSPSPASEFYANDYKDVPRDITGWFTFAEAYAQERVEHATKGLRQEIEQAEAHCEEVERSNMRLTADLQRVGGERDTLLDDRNNLLVDWQQCNRGRSTLLEALRIIAAKSHEGYAKSKARDALRSGGFDDALKGTPPAEGGK